MILYLRLLMKKNKKIIISLVFTCICLSGISQSKKKLKLMIENISADSLLMQKKINSIQNTLVYLDSISNIQKEEICIREEAIIHRMLTPAVHSDDIEKPIIYLYPEKTQKINIELDFNGQLTHTYPKYEKGWNITAEPNGKIIDKNNKEYYALYWEGISNEEYKIDKGHVIPGAKTIEFLENMLSNLGLNRREANEFIIYWLPRMENNPYNLIHFSTAQYEEMAKLKITPHPENLIRVMMVFKALDHPIKIQKQNIKPIKTKRKGFTVVEWGGHELPKSYSLDL
tara:strand:- start:14 stop:868 length:855 start_codon:yes stop_codon:yes gene_type:complete